jgi:tripartite-type tricarboxylate transporter receptor subunit TctC
LAIPAFLRCKQTAARRRDHAGHELFPFTAPHDAAKIARPAIRITTTVGTTREDVVKAIIRTLIAVVALAFAGSALAQQYPSKPVKIVVPFPPAGVTDIAARLIAQKLSEKLGQQFFVENIAGAGGNIGMANVAKAPGDGYTILFASSSIVVNPSLYNVVPYDIDKDFIPVTKAGATPNSWVVNPGFPAKTMKELVDLIKREPDLSLDFVVVPFKGGGPMTQSLLGGHTPIVCSALGNYVALLKQGKLRALAVAAKKRSAAMPDVPTLDELGIPAGTPKAIVDLLQKEISAIVNAPDIKKRLLELGIEAEGDSQASFAAYVKNELAKWKKVIADAKIKKI